jgi:poly-gamma-glutamate synthesis protein (capsule biosynthesis protein)
VNTSRARLYLTLVLAAAFGAAALALAAYRLGREAGASVAPTPTASVEVAKAEDQVALTAAPPLAGDASEAPRAAASFLACGDILLARTPGARAEAHGYRYLFRNVKDLVSSADFAFANLENPASYLGKPYPGKPENLTFRAEPAALFGLAWAGFDFISLANNHINDYGPRALAETLDYLDLLGVARAGAGRDAEEARRPAIVERDGVRVAVLAYAEPIWSVVEARSSAAYRAVTRSERGAAAYSGEAFEPVPAGLPDAAGSSRAGLAVARVEEMRADVARALSIHKPDYLFVSVHWGEEHERYPRAFQRRFGRAAIDAGATAVLGHHPHVLQSIERYGDGLIVYSLGNFVFDMASSATYESASIRFVLNGGRLERAEIIPIVIARYEYAPAPARGAEALEILHKLKAWSAPYGTELRVEGELGIIDF